jgi:hypothetical protein
MSLCLLFVRRSSNLYSFCVSMPYLMVACGRTSTVTTTNIRLIGAPASNCPMLHQYQSAGGHRWTVRPWLKFTIELSPTQGKLCVLDINQERKHRVSTLSGCKSFIRATPSRMPALSQTELHWSPTQRKAECLYLAAFGSNPLPVPPTFDRDSVQKADGPSHQQIMGLIAGSCPSFGAET